MVTTWKPALKVDDVAKAIGIAGLILFGALFTSYRAYFGQLGLDPEELGVDNLYVLARAIGFLAIMTALAGLYYLMLVSDEGSWWAGAVAGMMTVALLRSILPRSWPEWLFLILLMVVGAGGSQLRQVKGPWFHIVIVALLTVILPSVGSIGHASVRGDRAAAGKEVDPYTWLGLPVVDVRARRATVIWVGPSAQKPTGVFGDVGNLHVDALVLGRGSGSTVFLVGTGADSHVIRLSDTFVAVKTRPT